MRIAVPRGALFKEALDVLDGLGIDTAEVRSNDRKLLFEESGLITMRPSDVPTYVEAGAADLGIVGKDVLMEQAEREVYELLDLGYGECRMVLASVDGETDPAAEALTHLRGFKDLDHYWIEIHRLENDGDRLSRDAVASLFASGIDPMVVIRWKDIFAVLERAIDATETAAHILEGIVIKNA
jgi:hypothetical protein